MFKKSLESMFNDYYMKYYDYDSSIYDAINTIINSGINFSEVRVTDKGDVGMKYFGGKYSFDDFMTIYERIKLDIDTLGLYFGKNNDSIQISIEEKDIILVTKSQDLDLNNLLEKKKTL